MKPPSPRGRTVTCRSLRGQRTQYPAETVRFRPAAYGLCVQNGRVLLARSSFTGRWEPPGGAFEPWEPLEEGLAREFAEETGIRVRPRRLVDFRDDFVAFFDHPFHSLRFYYLVELLQNPPPPPSPDAEEVLEVAWKSRQELEAMGPDLLTDADRALCLKVLPSTP
jgi:8-oxo-dGTP diphosphatase